MSTHLDTLYGLAYTAEADGKPDHAAALREVAAELVELSKMLELATIALDQSILDCEMLLNDVEGLCLN